jgi:hypothetical protein
MHARARSQEFVQRDLFGWRRRLAYRHPDPPGAGDQSLRAPPRTIALSGIGVVAFILSLVWCLYAKESLSVDGKWVPTERQVAHQANPDDYVEALRTLVLRSAGAADISQ